SWRLPETCGVRALAQSPDSRCRMARPLRLPLPGDVGAYGGGEIPAMASAWKERVCEEVRPFSHGTVFRSPRHPDFWEYNCIRLDREMDAGEMIAAADRELVGCAHRFVEWMIPMPDRVVGGLREWGWIANPLIFMLH